MRMRHESFFMYLINLPGKDSQLSKRNNERVFIAQNYIDGLEELNLF